MLVRNFENSGYFRPSYSSGDAMQKFQRKRNVKNAQLLRSSYDAKTERALAKLITNERKIFRKEQAVSTRGFNLRLHATVGTDYINLPVLRQFRKKLVQLKVKKDMLDFLRRHRKKGWSPPSQGIRKAKKNGAPLKSSRQKSKFMATFPEKKLMSFFFEDVSS